MPEEWSVQVVCHDNDKVDSGLFFKGRWKFMKDRNLPLTLRSRGDTSAEIFSQCYIKEQKVWSGQRVVK